MDSFRQIWKPPIRNRIEWHNNIEEFAQGQRSFKSLKEAVTDLPLAQFLP